MPGPANERIKRYLDKRTKEAADKAAARENLERLEQERKATAERVLQKWKADTQVIVGILSDLQRELAPARAAFNFQDVGSGEKAIAIGHVIGELSGEHIDLTLSVDRDGNVQGAKGAPFAHSKLRLISHATFSIFAANAGEYEALILDLLGVD
jgi:hypothetical protein